MEMSLTLRRNRRASGDILRKLDLSLLVFVLRRVVLEVLDRLESQLVCCPCDVVSWLLHVVYDVNDRTYSYCSSLTI